MTIAQRPSGEIGGHRRVQRKEDAVEPVVGGVGPARSGTAHTVDGAFPLTRVPHVLRAVYVKLFFRLVLIRLALERRTDWGHDQAREQQRIQNGLHSGHETAPRHRVGPIVPGRVDLAEDAPSRILLFALEFQHSRSPR